MEIHQTLISDATCFQTFLQMKSLKCLEKLTNQKNKSHQIASINSYRKKIYERGTETLYTSCHIRNSSIC